MSNTIPTTIQLDIANITLICFVVLVGLTILNAIGFAILPTINTSNKSATKNPSQKSFKRLLKNWAWNPSFSMVCIMMSQINTPIVYAIEDIKETTKEVSFLKNLEDDTKKEL